MNPRKNLVVSIVLIVVLSLGLSVVQASPPQQSGDGQRTITVTGLGSATGDPDIAYMNIGVDSADADIMAAMDDNNQRIDAVKAVLADNGVEQRDIRTEYFNVFQDKGYIEGPAMTDAPESQYRVNHGLRVTVRDVERVGELLGATIEAGANAIHGISFSIADRGALESTARVNALADAKARAQQLADELGVELGDVLHIDEHADSFGPMYADAGFGGGAPPIDSGMLNVRLSLTVTYAIQ